jgi:hypothetical protein
MSKDKGKLHNGQLMPEKTDMTVGYEALLETSNAREPFLKPVLRPEVLEMPREETHRHVTGYPKKMG